MCDSELKVNLEVEKERNSEGYISGTGIKRGQEERELVGIGLRKEKDD